VSALSPLTAAPLAEYIATCDAAPLFTVPDPPPPPPLPQSDPVPVTTPVVLTCKHCVAPVIPANVTPVLNVTGVLKVALADKMLNFALAAFVPGSFT
jgi:hypothetical protein